MLILKSTIILPFLRLLGKQKNLFPRHEYGPYELLLFRTESQFADQALFRIAFKITPRTDVAARLGQIPATLATAAGQNLAFLTIGLVLTSRIAVKPAIATQISETFTPGAFFK